MLPDWLIVDVLPITMIILVVIHIIRKRYKEIKRMKNELNK